MNKAGEIWTKLSAIDVNGKTERKGNLTYLSWAWAWGVLMEHYPQAVYEFNASFEFQDGTMMVNVTVTIDDVSRTMWLPVLDYKNKPIQNPSAMDINTARMRCLTKCISMFGLGHYIYAGEDLPEAVKIEQSKQPWEFSDAAKKRLAVRHANGDQYADVQRDINGRYKLSKAHQDEIWSYWQQLDEAA